MKENYQQQVRGSSGLWVIRKQPQRAVVGESDAHVLRDGSTGLALPHLSRVWAVADETVAPKKAAGLELVKPLAPAPAVPVATAPNATFEVAFYRKYTEALLRRYVKMRLESGRVPSLLGREMFRGNVTHYRVHGFDDVIIFCHDVESQLERLNGTDRQLIRRIALQGYTYGEMAGMVGVSLRTVVRRYATALDRLTRLLVECVCLNRKNLVNRAALAETL